MGFADSRFAASPFLGTRKTHNGVAGASTCARARARPSVEIRDSTDQRRLLPDLSYINSPINIIPIPVCAASRIRARR